ncbi:hypothetical protein LCGC14_0951100, partial [marine sediment metagenome]
MSFALVNNITEIGPFLNDLQNCDAIYLDTETTSLDVFDARLLLLQCKLNNNTYIFMVDNIKKEYVKYIVSLLNDSGKVIVGHNIKFDIKILFNHTGELFSNVYDTMLAEVLLYMGIGSKYNSYKELAKKYCDVEIDKGIRDEFIATKNITQEMLIYSALDVEYLSSIRNKQLEKVNELNLNKVLDLENRLSPVIASMELNGVLLNAPAWEKLEAKVIIELAKIKKILLDNIIKKIISTKEFPT